MMITQTDHHPLVFTIAHDLEAILAVSTAHHDHLCPRQILGARLGLAGMAALGIQTEKIDKRTLIIAETDGCFIDGLEAATGASVGHRTLRIEDYGKIGATFIDVRTGRAIRLAPLSGIRARAASLIPDARSRYHAQLDAYQIMPDDEMFSVSAVELTTPVQTLISRPGVRVNCDICGEEIINQREILRNDLTLCCTCAGGGYYHTSSI
jgi:formylmethanofuran dehydrogenase subunit E